MDLDVKAITDEIKGESAGMPAEDEAAAGDPAATYEGDHATEAFEAVKNNDAEGFKTALKACIAEMMATG